MKIVHGSSEKARGLAWSDANIFYEIQYAFGYRRLWDAGFALLDEEYSFDSGSKQGNKESLW